MDSTAISGSRNIFGEFESHERSLKTTSFLIVSCLAILSKLEKTLTYIVVLSTFIIRKISESSAKIAKFILIVLYILRYVQIILLKLKLKHLIQR